MAKTDWKIYEIQHRRGPSAPDYGIIDEVVASAALN
jgi:hypothetical protein